MITLNCSQCHARLEMDDAFAGGVCRCQYCGTIQTVPLQSKRADGPPAPAAEVPAPPRVSPATHQPATETGLDALAQALTPGPLERTAPGVSIDYARPSRQTRHVPLTLVLLVGLALILGLLGGYFLMTARMVVVSGTPTTTGAAPRGNGSASPPSAARATQRSSEPGTEDSGEDPAVRSSDPGIPAPRFPEFCGISLQGAPSVIYVLDRGQATAELFDALKEATYRSLETLKPEQRFQIIFWDNGGDPAAYPADGLAPANSEHIEAAQRQFAELLAGGRARADAAVRLAAAQKPAAIVLVTGKPFDLDEELVETVRDALRGGDTKVHAVALRSDDNTQVLREIAKITHGEFKFVTSAQLRAYSY